MLHDIMACIMCNIGKISKIYKLTFGKTSCIFGKILINKSCVDLKDLDLTLLDMKRFLEHLSVRLGGTLWVQGRDPCLVPSDPPAC